MRVALDATPLTVASGGIARYTAELAAALAAEFPEDEYWLVSDQAWQGGPVACNLRAGRPPGHWITRRWWLAGLPLELRRLGAMVFHGTNFAVPYLPLVCSVMTLHDLSPWTDAEWRSEEAARIRRRAPFMLRLATMVLTPTESVRREAIQRFHLSPARTVAVPLAAGQQFRPRLAPEIAPTLARLGVAAPYILFIGTAERRKNLSCLVAAWRQVRARLPDLKLVLAGRPGEDPAHKQVLNIAGEPGLIQAGLLPDEEVAALLAGAALFVYPSLYEGFGLPVLEAMQSGAPVVISRDPALEEVAGGAAEIVKEDSSAELARAIVELMGDPRRLELRERGIRRAAQFSWRYTAIRTHEVYGEALRRF